MIKVYVAGPYTKGDPALNVRSAIQVGNTLAKSGFAVFVPHLTHFWHFLCPNDYEFWLTQDLAWLEVCDCLLRIPGESSGADREVQFALDHDILVFDNIYTLMNYHAGTAGAKYVPEEFSQVVLHQASRLGSQSSSGFPYVPCGFRSTCRH
jgi:hypothetical protein